MQHPTPRVGLKPFSRVTVAAVGVAKAQVVVPPGPHHNLAAVRVLLFVEILAQTVGVHVFGDLVGEIHFNERLRIDVRRITELGVGEIGACQGVFKCCEVRLDVLKLEGMQVVRLRLVHLNLLGFAPKFGVRRIPAALVIALDSVHLHDVSAGHFVACSVSGQQRGDVHAVVVSLDVFHEHVHPSVVSVDVKLAVPASGGVLADRRPHFVNDGVAHQGLVGIRPVEDPIVLSRHAHERHVVVGTGGILRFQGVRLLGEELGGRPPNLDGDLTVVLVGLVGEGVETSRQVRDLHVGHDARVVQDGGVGRDLDQRQRRLVHVNTRSVVFGGRVKVIDG